MYWLCFFLTPELGSDSRFFCRMDAVATSKDFSVIDRSFICDTISEGDICAIDGDSGSGATRVDAILCMRAPMPFRKPPPPVGEALALRLPRIPTSPADISMGSNALRVGVCDLASDESTLSPSSRVITSSTGTRLARRGTDSNILFPRTLNMAAASDALLAKLRLRCHCWTVIADSMVLALESCERELDPRWLIARGGRRVRRFMGAPRALLSIIVSMFSFINARIRSVAVICASSESSRSLSLRTVEAAGDLKGRSGGDLSEVTGVSPDPHAVGELGLIAIL